MRASIPTSSNRQVFDAVMANIAGAARIDVNRRWATPTALGQFTATSFPFADSKQRDPVTGRRGRRAREPARARSSAEDLLYQHRRRVPGGGRSAALIHTTPDGARDLALPDNERVYFLAGSQHGPARFPSAVTNGQQKENPNDYWLAMRALMVAMDKWVRDRVAPPPSRYPRLQDGTLVRAADVAFPESADRHIAAVAVRRRPRRESSGGTGWRRRDAAAAARAAGGSGWKRARRNPAARHRRAAGDLYRLELPQAGDRRARSVVSADGIVRGVSAHQEPSAKRRRTRGRSIEERYPSREQYLTLVQEAGAATGERSLSADRRPAASRRARRRALGSADAQGGDGDQVRAATSKPART